MDRATITVLAGTNGAGKSSVGGSYLRQAGATYFNPDEAAREILARNPGFGLEKANSLAWEEGLRQLRKAIAENSDYVFESTLGGHTIAATLEQAIDSGMHVRIWYVGLNSPELHIARVQERVARGGHDIPEDRIRQRYDQSRRNIIRLLPRLAELRVFDNSVQAALDDGDAPRPVLLLHMRGGRVVAPAAKIMARTPEWAKPIAEAALTLQEGSG